jgi:hypothetical protein
MAILIHAPYAKEHFETTRQHSILHPEGIVGNLEVIQRNVGEQRAGMSGNSEHYRRKAIH